MSAPASTNIRATFFIQGLWHRDSYPEFGYESGYGYCLQPYGAAYRRALRTTRTRTRTRIGLRRLLGVVEKDEHGEDPLGSALSHQPLDLVVV